MTTTTSFSERGRFLPLYRFSLRQNAGYFVLASLLIFLFYPLQYLMEVFKKVPPDYFSGWDPGVPLDPFQPYTLYGLGRNFTEISMVFFTILFLLLPFVLALMLNSYMHSKKAADVYHALPIRRELLMAVNAAVAMTIVAVPFLVSTAVVAVAGAVKFGAAAPLGFLLLDMVAWLACAFLIYAVTALICTQVGTVFDTFFFSGVFFFMLPVLIWLAVLMGQLFLYGFTVPADIWRVALWLSPVLFPIERMAMYNYDSYRFGTEIDQAQLEAFNAYFPKSNVVMVIYIVLGAAILLLAMRLYTRRHSERAETTTSKGAAAVAVQFVATLLGGVFTGAIFYSIGEEQVKPVFLLWCVIGGLLIFAVLEVILNRGFKTLLRRLPLGAVMVAVTVGFSVLTMTGGLGYEKRVPDPETIDSVGLRWNGSYGDMGYGAAAGLRWYKMELSSPEAMKILSEFHKAVANEQYDRHEEEMFSQGKHQATAYMDIKYNRSGLSLERSYGTMSTETLAKLIPLELSEEFQKQANPVFLLEPSQIDSWGVSNAFGWDEKIVRLPREDSRRLLEALRADYLAEDPESVLHPQEKVAAHLTITCKSFDMEYTAARRYARAAIIDGDNNAVYTPVSGPETIKVLRELNLLPGEPDLSQCAGAYVTPARSYYIYNGQARWDVNGSMILRRNDICEGGIQQYQALKEQAEIEYQEDTHFQNLYAAGYRKTFVEDPDKLATLAENLVPSWKADESVLEVCFYNKDPNSISRSVLVPVTKLPVPLQEELDPGPSGE